MSDQKAPDKSSPGISSGSGLESLGSIGSIAITRNRSNRKRWYLALLLGGVSAGGVYAWQSGLGTAYLQPYLAEPSLENSASSQGSSHVEAPPAPVQVIELATESQDLADENLQGSTAAAPDTAAVPDTTAAAPVGAAAVAPASSLPPQAKKSLGSSGKSAKKSVAKKLKKKKALVRSKAKTVKKSKALAAEKARKIKASNRARLTRSKP